MQRRAFQKTLLLALKIGLGSSLAIWIAEVLNLQNSVAAGSITLLTLVTTKWGTVRLSFARVITFALAVLLSILLFAHPEANWMVFGIFVFLIVAISDALGWIATISVNVLIGAHFLTSGDFSKEFIINEFMLVLIGIVLALVLNLIYDYRGQKKHLIENMHYVEKKLQMILGELAAYLSNKQMQRNVWKDIEDLEEHIKKYIIESNDYQDNTFQSHPGYYIDYFEMRLSQCNILHNLHQEARRMRTMPKQSRVVAEYIMYMMDYVVEKNMPDPQIERLEQIILDMKQEDLPVTREEFESRALLYHILMDLEDFFLLKKRFIEDLDDTKRRLYWNE